MGIIECQAENRSKWNHMALQRNSRLRAGSKEAPYLLTTRQPDRMLQWTGTIVERAPPFDVNTPNLTEIAGVHFDNYIDWMKACWSISATGNPAASVPAGFTPVGLPVGAAFLSCCRRGQ